MDGFQLFNTGNRKKFLDQAKKKKEQTGGLGSSNTDQRLIIKMQKNIRAFLQYQKQQSELKNIVNNFKNCSEEKMCDQLTKLQKGSTFIFNVLHFTAIKIAYQRSRSAKQVEKNGQLMGLLGKVAYRVASIFDRLNTKTKQFWIDSILSKSAQFSLQFLRKSQIEQITDIIISKPQRFVRIVGSLPYGKLVEELIFLVCQRSYNGRELSEQGEDINLPVGRAYENIMKAIENRNVREVGKQTKFLLMCLNYIVKELHRQCLMQVMNRYKINPNLVQSEGDILEQIIGQKQEWQCFIEYLRLHNKFNESVLRQYIYIDNYQQALKINSYVLTILEIIPVEYSIQISLEELMTCLLRISQWVKIHEIVDNQEQQILLLSYLYLVDRKLYSITDKQFVALAKQQGDALERVLKDKLIKIIYKMILGSKLSRTVQKITKICINLLQQIYNRIFRTGVLSTQIFVNEVMSRKLMAFSQAKIDQEVVQFVHKFPFVFSLRDRARKFSEMLRKSHYEQQQMEQDYYEGNHHIGKVRIRRGHQFQDAFYALSKKNIKKGFQISFIDQFGQQQRGVDAGGLTKQLINRVLKAAFQSKLGLFMQNSNKQLMPFPEKVQVDTGLIAQQYEFIGKMIGKALFEGITIGPKFCGPFLNAVIGKKNNFDDLKNIDKELYNSLTYIKTMKEDASQLYLTFQYRDDITKKNVNLKLEGHKIRVTNENKDEYVSLLANYKVNKLLEHQSRHIRRGLKKVINSEWLFMFNYEQLNYLISGSGEIKVQQLRAYTKYVGYSDNDVTIKMFWSTVAEFSEQEKSNLLMFVTACPRPSFLGFQELSPPFTIVKAQNKTHLPVSHTCSNILELPDYKNKAVLAQMLRMAINSNSGFDIS